MCPPGYYKSANGLMVTHALGRIIYGFMSVTVSSWSHMFVKLLFLQFAAYIFNFS